MEKEEKGKNTATKKEVERMKFLKRAQSIENKNIKMRELVKQKTYLSKKINKINKPLAQLTRIRRGRRQITSVKKKEGHHKGSYI